jgi:serine/threonine protein kinase
MYCVQLRHLQYIHSRNDIHRDLKPSNIVMGAGNQANLVYLINFGLSKEYQNPRTCAHISFDSGVGFTGTTTFASVTWAWSLEGEMIWSPLLTSYFTFFGGVYHGRA